MHIMFPEEKGEREGMEEEGARAHGSDLSGEEGCDPLLDLASQPCMLFTVWWHVAVNEQSLVVSATSLNLKHHPLGLCSRKSRKLNVCTQQLLRQQGDRCDTPPLLFLSLPGPFYTCQSRPV